MHDVIDQIAEDESRSHITRLSFKTDGGWGEVAKLGLLVLKEDQTIENEFRHYFPTEGVAIYHSRLPSPKEVTPQSLSQMEDSIAQSLELLPHVDFASIGFACTSASAVLGERQITKIISEYFKTSVTNPITAAKAAIKAVGTNNVLFINPYIESVSKIMKQSLEEDGIEVVHEASFNETNDSVVAHITEESIIDGVANAFQQYQSDCVFISCTNLRTTNAISALESRLHVPVISSNQALAWHMSQLSGLTTNGWEYGRLGRYAAS